MPIILWKYDYAHINLITFGQYWMQFLPKMFKKVSLFNHVIIFCSNLLHKKEKNFKVKMLIHSLKYWVLIFFDLYFFLFLLVCCFILLTESHKTSWKFQNWGRIRKSLFPLAGFYPWISWESGFLATRPRELR